MLLKHSGNRTHREEGPLQYFSSKFIRKRILNIVTIAHYMGGDGGLLPVADEKDAKM